MATTSSSATSSRRRSTRCERASCRSTSPGSTSSSSGTASGSTSRPTWARRSTGADVVYIAVGTPPTYSGDADLSDVWTVVDELPQVDRRIVARDEEHRAGRHGPRGPAPPRRSRPGERRLRLEPRVHGRGNGRARLHASRPDRDRRVRRRRRRRGRRAPRRDRRARRANRCGVGRDGEARVECVPDDARELHQRDRKRLRGDRSGRRRGRRGRRSRSSPRPALPARRDRVRRLLLPEGLARAQAARGELGLQLPAPECRHRGERAPEATRHREARAATRPASRQAHRAPRARVQARHRRHARGAEPGARRPAPLRGRRGERVGSGRGRLGTPPRRRDSPSPRSRRSTARTPPCS